MIQRYLQVLPVIEYIDTYHLTPSLGLKYMSYLLISRHASGGEQADYDETRRFSWLESEFGYLQVSYFSLRDRCVMYTQSRLKHVFSLKYNEER